MAEPTMPQPVPQDAETAAVTDAITAATTVIAKRTVGLSAEELASIERWDDLAPYLAQFDGTANATELGDGTDRVQKELLVGKAFIILALDFPMGDKGEYALVRGMTHNGTKVRFSDGGTGIYQQLSNWMARNNEQFRPLWVPNGLTASKYTVRDDDGNPILDEKGLETKAVTYYINTTDSI
jgi:hypothetical protein